MLIQKYCLLLVLAAGSFFSLSANTDSCSRSNGFHVLLSFKPLLNAMSAKDSSAHYMYSHNQIEVQYNYGRHQLGFGFDAGSKKSSTSVNNLPKQIKNTFISIAPSYSFRLYQEKKWKIFFGAGYFKNTIKQSSDLISQIEVITETTNQVEEGLDMFFRFNFALSKHFSLETEVAAYRSRERIEYSETYSLTPSLASSKTEYRDYRTYAFPANIWLKYSF